jgi:hypothetical protein
MRLGVGEPRMEVGIGGECLVLEGRGRSERTASPEPFWPRNWRRPVHLFDSGTDLPTEIDRSLQLPGGEALTNDYPSNASS